MRSEADWSDTSESDAESTATVLDNTVTGGQVAPLLAPTMEPGPVGPAGCHRGLYPPPPTSGDTATAVIPYRHGYTPHGGLHATDLPEVLLKHGLSDEEFPCGAPER